MEATKKCSKCGEVKSVGEFSKSKTPDGLNYYCKECLRIIARAYRERIGTEGVKEIRDRYTANNKEKIKLLQKESRERHKEKRKAVFREYYYANKEKVNKQKAKRAKERLKEDKLFAVREQIRQTIKNSFKKNGFSKSCNTAKLLGCDWEFFKSYIEVQFQKGMTWDNHGEWEYDHIIPVSSAKTEEGLIKLNHYTNFRPLWRKDNNDKSNKIVEGIQFKII